MEVGEAGAEDKGTTPNGAVLNNVAALRSPQLLDECSLDALIEIKVARFLNQLGDYSHDNLYTFFMEKFEKAFLTQVMRHTGGNQMQASRLLKMNRNTLRKRLRHYEIC